VVDGAQHLESENSRLVTVLRSFTAVASSLDLERSLQMACESAVRLLDVSHSGLVLFSPDNSKGRVQAEYPEQIGTKGLEIPLRDVPAEEALLTSLRPLVVTDVAAETSLGTVRDVRLQFDINSILFVPIVGKTGILGSFSLDSIGRQRQFSIEEIELCKAFAAQIAVSIENATLYAHARKKAEELENLRDAALAITASHDAKTVLDSIIHAAMSLIGAKGSGIYEYSTLDRTSRLAATSLPPHLRKELLLSGNTLADRLVDSAARFTIHHDYKPWAALALEEHNEPLTAVLAVKLEWQSRCLGILYVNDVTGRVFTPDDARVLGLFADHAAGVTENATLIAREAETERRLRLLLNASAILADSDTPELGLHSLAELLVTSLHGTFCRIALLDEGGLSYVVRAAWPIRRHTDPLQSQPCLGQQIQIDDLPDFTSQPSNPRHALLRYSDEVARTSLINWSQRVGLSDKSIQSLLLLPLRHGEATVGIVEPELCTAVSLRWRAEAR